MDRVPVRKNEYIKIAVITLAGVYGLSSTVALTTTDSVALTNSFLLLLMFGLALGLMKRIMPEYREIKKATKLNSIVFASLLSIALHMGSRMEALDNVQFTDINLYIDTLLSIPMLAILMWKLTGIISDWCGGINKSINTSNKNQDADAVTLDSDKNNNKKTKNGIIKIWLAIMIMWLPVFLSMYPGAFVYDAQDEYIEVITRVFTTHHPLLHVLLLGGIIHAFEYVGLGANLGIAVYVLIQMSVLAAVLTYSIKLMKHWGINKKYIMGMIFFYGLFPIFPMYAICTAKDTYFTAFFFLSVLMLIHYVRSREEFRRVHFLMLILSAAVAMLLRNNAVYAYIVASVPLFFLGESKKERFKISGGILLAVILALVINMGFKIATQATDNEHQEILTVPIQQLARVYTYSPEAIEDKSKLTEYIPEDYLGTYNLRISDVLKSGFNNKSYEADSRGFWELWIKAGLKKPLIYINGWLGTSYGYWYPDALNNVYKGNQMFTFQYGDSSYFGFETEPPGKRHSLIPPIEKLYRNISLELFQQRIPVVSMLFAPGMVFWAMMLMGMLLIEAKKWKSLIILSLPLLLWLTLLLGPTTLVRYVLILWFMLPIYPALTGYNSQKN